MFRYWPACRVCRNGGTCNATDDVKSKHSLSICSCLFLSLVLVLSYALTKRGSEWVQGPFKDLFIPLQDYNRPSATMSAATTVREGRITVLAFIASP